MGHSFDTTSLMQTAADLFNLLSPLFGIALGLMLVSFVASQITKTVRLTLDGSSSVTQKRKSKDEAEYIEDGEDEDVIPEKPKRGLFGRGQSQMFFPTDEEYDDDQTGWALGDDGELVKVKRGGDE